MDMEQIEALLDSTPLRKVFTGRLLMAQFRQRGCFEVMARQTPGNAVWQMYAHAQQEYYRDMTMARLALERLAQRKPKRPHVKAQEAKFVIVTERQQETDHGLLTEIRVFESTAKPENLAANYRDWINRWIKERGDFYNAEHEWFGALSAYHGTSVTLSTVEGSAARAVGMWDAEQKRKKAQAAANFKTFYDAAAPARLAARREQFEKLKAEFEPDAK